MECFDILQCVKDIKPTKCQMHLLQEAQQTSLTDGHPHRRAHSCLSVRVSPVHVPPHMTCPLVHHQRVFHQHVWEIKNLKIPVVTCLFRSKSWVILEVIMTTLTTDLKMIESKLDHIMINLE